MKKETTWQVIQRHLMTGIGYMIPIVIASSLIKAVGQTAVKLLAVDLNATGTLPELLTWITKVSADGFQGMMYPVFAAYVAYSIADRNGLAAGFAAGYLASQGKSGFFGALVGGFLAGYLVKWLASKIKLGRQWRTLLMFMIYPLISCAVIFLAMYYVIDPIGGLINSAFQALINYVGSFGLIPMYFILAGMMGSDCGGPINKAAFSISFTLAGGGFPMTPLICGAMVAPLGFGLAAIIDKVTKRNIFDEDLSAQGISSFIMGLFNITEGAIPLVLTDPAFMVPLNIIGSGISAVVEHLAGNETYLGGASGNILGWFAQPNPISWVLCLFTGPLFIALVTLWRRDRLNKKKAAEETVEAAEA